MHGSANVKFALNLVWSTCHPEWVVSLDFLRLMTWTDVTTASRIHCRTYIFIQA